MHSVCIGDRLKVASTHVVAVFRKSDGLVVHVHKTTVFEGARGVSKQEAMDEAVREAKCHGHDVQKLDLLVVEEEFPRETGILRVDKDRRKLVVEPHSSGEGGKFGPARTRSKKPSTRSKKTPTGRKKA